MFSFPRLRSVTVLSLSRFSPYLSQKAFDKIPRDVLSTHYDRFIIEGMATFRSLFQFLLIFFVIFSSESALKTRKYRRPGDSVRNEERLAASFVWANGSAIVFNSSDVAAAKGKSKVIDCFGLGGTVAQALEWWFTINENRWNAMDVRFYLSSRNQRRRVQVLVGDQFGLEWTDFKVERRTVFIVHGFMSHGNETWIREMEEAFLLWDDVNVVVVDWAARGNTFNYYRAVINTKIVGNEISKFLSHVVNATIDSSRGKERIKWGILHLVGHSLGAHICGVAAAEFGKLRIENSNWKVNRITGLDPAQPCFRNVGSALQLDRTDASFVDIIHTNGRLLSKVGLGLPDPIGHVDFYPNGGKRQPGCTRLQGSHFDFIPIPKPIIEQAICSHGRSYVYLTESIVAATVGNCTFWSHHWDRSYRRALQLMSEACNAESCTEMGIRAENHPQRGTFFAITSRTSPFCATDVQDREAVRRQLIADFTNEIRD